MKILEILAFNSKQFRVCGIFKKWQIDDDKVGGIKCINFLDNVCLKKKNLIKKEKEKSDQNLPFGIYLWKKNHVAL